MGYTTVRIHLHKATDLPAADFGIMGGKADPYIVFSLGVHQARSTCVRGSLNPEWTHAHFELKVDAERYATSTLDASVWDNDKLRKDDLLGMVSIPVKDIAEKHVTCTAYDITLEPKFLPRQPRVPVAPSRIHMTVQVLTATEAADVLYYEVWENERYGSTSVYSILKRKWSSHNLKRASGDPKRWLCSSSMSSMLGDTLLESDKFDDVIPTIPAGYMQVEGWHYVKTSGDLQGWVYSRSFEGPWFEEPMASFYVRRRKWMQVLHRRQEL
ncbi:hypothetical protein DYB37_002964 [Aphanomyces astaci]|uniref:C2 domain-containing protein n=1 Tax=Aphanomyces astaci TaxID=112090 RepID=A0A397BHQ8_APHAT|nr:hypothetical protein DYB25_001886 [Aphanomyces astaci]RHY18524.1 hypothetical protein DYB36_003876 [Aphanomyces astaci]RHY46624.1 hypothetical protein DYB30_001320 [Aphanomyces astaci]RHY54395.1 hypothetical protein DYB38_004963 [Aphanomyces astaci]RHY75512.1 hypothetical protein DYB34_002917 [Aphanomyces astaci]